MGYFTETRDGIVVNVKAVSGETGRQKRILLAGLSADAVRKVVES